MSGKRILTNKEIGARVKKRRKEIGMSQEKLAEILNVTYQQVQRYENGVNKLNVENIQLIADALSVPVSYFFEWDRTYESIQRPPPLLTVEENRLLGYFKRIKDRSSKDIVIRVARLARKKGN